MDIGNWFYREVLDSLFDGVYVVDKERRITYWNESAARITGFRPEEIAGTKCCDDLLMHIDSTGKELCEDGCPLSATISDGKSRSIDVFLRHKAGHRVPVLVKSVALREESGDIVGAVEVFNDNTEAISATERVKKLEQMAYVDELTGLANRRFLESAIEARHDETKRYGWRYGIILFDLDRFKPINDTYGHDAGDNALRSIAGTLRSTSRSSDIAGRWGGDEFVVVVANVNAKLLGEIAERYRVLISRSTFDLGGDAGRSTLSSSIGAAIARPEDTADSLFRRADAVMYKSKQAGGNAVTVEED